MSSLIIGKYISEFMCRNWPSYMKHYKSMSNENKIESIKDLQSLFGSESKQTVEKALKKLLAESRYVPSTSDINKEIMAMKACLNDLDDDVSLSSATRFLENEDYYYQQLMMEHKYALSCADWKKAIKIGADMSHMIIEYRKNRC